MDDIIEITRENSVHIFSRLPDNNAIFFFFFSIHARIIIYKQQLTMYHEKLTTLPPPPYAEIHVLKKLLKKNTINSVHVREGLSTSFLSLYRGAKKKKNTRNETKDAHVL